MSLSVPALLVAGLIITAALAAAVLAVSRRRRAQLAAAGFPAAGRGRPRGLWFSIAGLAVLSVAVAGPAATVPVTRSAGTVILAMDVSGSMGAPDVAPSRLAAAQQVALSFIKAQPDSVDIGVVAFGSGALTTATPSSDHTVAAAAVTRLGTASGTTSLGSAIIAALSAITRKAIPVGRNGTVPDIGYWPSATIVMFSDGQDEGQGPAVETATDVAEKAGVHIDTVGVGTTAGVTIDVDGYHPYTALDEGTLKKIAQATGGTYHPASSAGQLNDIASTINLRLTVTHERLPLAGALIAVAIALLAAGALFTIASSGRVI
jgi:Ca-activated chloride channel family protein